MKINEKIINGVRLSQLVDKDNTYINEVSANTNAEGAVLLKNDGMLPLKKGDKIAFFGRLQRDYYKSGTGSGGMVRTRYVTNIFDSLKESEYVVVDDELAEIYNNWIEKNPFDNGDGWTQPWSQQEMSLTDDVVKKASQRADKAIVVIGRTSGEEKDNSSDEGSYLLTQTEYNMLKIVSKYFKSTCVILNTGNVIDMKWSKELPINAVMYVWQGGQDGGRSIADVLCGKRYPSGKLSDTIVENIQDYPGYEDFKNVKENIYSEDVYVGYRYFETFARDKVIYPFGFGLSYTKFSTKILSVSTQNNELCVEIDVRNSGDFLGKEVIQVYYEGVGEKISRPARELVAFSKTKELKPGESQTILLSFKISDMAAYDDTGISGNKSCYVLDEGKYNIYVGTDVRSAEKVYTYEQTQTEVIEQLSKKLVPTRNFERIVNINGEVCFETVKGDLQNNQYNNTTKDEYIGDKGIKLVDVYEGKAKLKSFLEQLSDFDLACLSQGEGMNSIKVRPGTGGTFGGVTRELQYFGIPAVCVTDGPSGLRFDNEDFATSLPNGTLMACTWNTALVEELYTLEGMEGYINRVDGLLGPGINIHRLPLCGRNFEYLSEDPYLAGKIATGMCIGLQNGGMTGTIKHFAANNKEENRTGINMVISERALREIYLKPFEMVVKSNAVSMLMTAYNKINGTYCPSSYDLNTGILRDEWGYDGVVMTDWWAKTCGDEMNDFDRIRDYPIKAQNDVYMVNPDAEETANGILDSINCGKITRHELVRNAKNILNVIMKTSTFERYIEGDIIGVDSIKDISNMNLCSVFENVKSGEQIEILAQTSDEYVLKIEYVSDKSEVMQIPIRIYLDDKNAGVCMIRGTQGKEENILSGIYLIRGNHKIHLQFESDSLQKCMIEIYGK